MVLKIDQIEYQHIVVGALQRKIVIETGKNGGTFLSGDRFNDVRHSYYEYSLTICPSLAHKEEYEELFALLSLPVESHEITVPYGQGYITYNAYVSSVSDKLRKRLPSGNIWEGFTVNFIGTEARKV